MFINIFMSAVFFSVALIIYLVMRNEAKPKKNLILGVTLPYDARQDESVGAVVRGFLLLEIVIFIFLVLLLVPPIILNSYSVMMMWLFVWMIFALVLPGIPFVCANKKLKALKSENGWYSAAAGVTLVDTKLASAPKKPLSVLWFVPAAAITLVPVIHSIIALRGHDEFWPLMSVYLSFFALAAVSWFLYKVVFRQKAEVVDGNTAQNAMLTQIRRYNWGKSWILIIWLTAVFDIVFWLSGFDSAAVLLLTVAYTVLLMAFVLHTEFKTRRMQQKLTQESGRAVYTDDDDKWLFGMFYNNPNDEHLMVNKRTGIGMTMNMAKAPAKILMGFVVLVLLSMPLIGLFIMHEGSTPVGLTFDGTQLAAHHTGKVYDLDISDIESAYLLDALPSGGVRTNGTAMETVLKGNFRYDGLGDCRVCLNPQVPPFIVVETAETMYIFGSNDAGETHSVYKALLNLGVSVGALQ
jgi:uncharacterized membrane protein